MRNPAPLHSGAGESVECLLWQVAFYAAWTCRSETAILKCKILEHIQIEYPARDPSHDQTQCVSIKVFGECEIPHAQHQKQGVIPRSSVPPGIHITVQWERIPRLGHPSSTVGENSQIDCPTRDPHQVLWETIPRLTVSQEIHIKYCGREFSDWLSHKRSTSRIPRLSVPQGIHIRYCGREFPDWVFYKGSTSGTMGEISQIECPTRDPHQVLWKRIPRLSVPQGIHIKYSGREFPDWVFPQGIHIRYFGRDFPNWVSLQGSASSTMGENSQIKCHWWSTSSRVGENSQIESQTVSNVPWKLTCCGGQWLSLVGSRIGCLLTFLGRIGVESVWWDL